MTSFWMAKGSVLPRSVSALDTARDTPRSAKDCEDIWDFLGSSGALCERAADDSGGYG
jgi:hypothetical protein